MIIMSLQSQHETLKDEILKHINAIEALTGELKTYDDKMATLVKVESTTGSDIQISEKKVSTYKELNLEQAIQKQVEIKKGFETIRQSQREELRQQLLQAELVDCTPNRE